MKCTQCQEREAVIHLTQMANDQVTTLHLCERCAAEKGVESATLLSKAPVGSLVAALGEGLTLPGAVSRSDFACPHCGATLEDFRTTGRLGCRECYRALAEPLRELLRRLHGATLHVGERYVAPDTPPETASRKEREHELRDQLQRAVETENFELAAQLRDQLRVLQG